MMFSSASGLNQLVTVGLWAFAAFEVWRGALLGARAHVRPRIFVAVGSTMIAVFVAADMFGWVSASQRADGVRAAGWIVAGGLAFTAITGRRYGQKVKQVVEVLGDLHDGGDQGEG